MANEEPVTKKSKRAIFSEHIYSDEFQELFANHWLNRIDIKNENLELVCEPFRVCRIFNFLKDEDYMDDIKNELLDVKSRRNSIDLYQFEQTKDLSTVQSKNIKLFHETFQTDLAAWMEKNTKIELNSTISMSSACYSDTDFLLCHDDNMGDRRIAFVLYISRDWASEDGGTLDLFDTDEYGQPRNIVKSLLPEYNSLVFFEVEDNSYHQVAEILSPVKARWTINGWFHGPIMPSTKPPRPEIELKFVEPEDKEVPLDEWIAECYLMPHIIKQIQRDIERDSFSFLKNFFKTELYEKILTEICSDTITWERVGPADVRNYEVAREDTLPKAINEFCDIFKSISMVQLLRGYTELDIVPGGDADAKPKLTIELQRWSQGCYTLLCDKAAPDETESSNNSQVSPHTTPHTSQTDNDDSRLNDSDDRDRKNISSSGSNKESEDNEEDVLRRILKGRSPKAKKKAPSLSPPQRLPSPPPTPPSPPPRLPSPPPRLPSPSLRLSSPSKKLLSLAKFDEISIPKSRTMDTDDSDVSDIGDYLSDRKDYSAECSEEEKEEPRVTEPGSLDVIIQFGTERIITVETIDYVDPKEQEGELIHVPAKDNHLCLVYKTLSTCRLHKYVNHYCEGYFYNLICTYFE